MASEITVRELRDLSEAQIQALPHAIPIKSGDDTIGFIMPYRKPSQERVKKVLAEIDAAAAKRTAEETRALEILLGEREPD